MPERYRLTSFRMPESLLMRARTVVFNRNLKGGVTRIVCDALEAHLDTLEKVPLRFEVVWLRLKGYEASEAEKVACYGGKHQAQRKMGDPVYLPRDWFTSTELLAHYFSGTWDRNTARLIHQQQRTWLARGQERVELPIEPPGWVGYPTDDADDSTAP